MSATKDQAEVTMNEHAKSGEGPIALKQLDEQLRELTAQAPPFYRSRNLSRLYVTIFFGCLTASVTLGFDSAMMNGLQAVPTWDTYFHKPRGALLGILSAILSLGAICATPFISYVGDKWGRRAGIRLGCLIMMIGGILQGSSVSFAMFLVSRFVIGFGLVFANTYAPILISELAHPKDRQVITSLYQTSWYLGAIAAAWTTFGTFAIRSEWAWRIPSLLQGMPAVISIIGVFFLPESPRWLIANGKAEQAKDILIKYHADGDASSELVKLEYKEMVAIIGAESENKTHWKVLVQTKGNRRRLLILIMLGLFSQWSGNGLVSYYLARVLETVGVTSAREQNIINGSLMIWNWFCAVGSAFLTARLPRRTQFMISVVGMLACFASQTLCAGIFNTRHDQAAGKAVIAMLFLFYSFYNLAFNALLYSYPVEILPYPIRAKGFSILMFFGKAANFINSLVNPIGLKAIGWKYYFVYVGWLCIETAGIYLFFVETKGPSLEAIAERFDHEKKVVHADGYVEGKEIEVKQAS